MQRLLRGRKLYFFLGALIVWLYAYAIMTGQGKLREKEWEEQPTVTTAAHKAIEIFPESIDPATMQRLAKEKPFIALVTSFTSLLATAMIIFGFVLSFLGIFSGRESQRQNTA